MARASARTRSRGSPTRSSRRCRPGPRGRCRGVYAAIFIDAIYVKVRDGSPEHFGGRGTTQQWLAGTLSMSEFGCTDVRTPLHKLAEAAFVWGAQSVRAREGQSLTCQLTGETT